MARGTLGAALLLFTLSAFSAAPCIAQSRSRTHAIRLQRRVDAIWRRHRWPATRERAVIFLNEYLRWIRALDTSDGRAIRAFVHRHRFEDAAEFLLRRSITHELAETEINRQLADLWEIPDPPTCNDCLSHQTSAHFDETDPRGGTLRALAATERFEAIRDLALAIEIARQHHLASRSATEALGRLEQSRDGTTIRDAVDAIPASEWTALGLTGPTGRFDIATPGEVLDERGTLGQVELIGE